MEPSLRPSLAKARKTLEELAREYELDVEPDALVEDLARSKAALDALRARVLLEVKRVDTLLMELDCRFKSAIESVSETEPQAVIDEEEGSDV